jgi:trans-AT polyketide synthase/acyltransferase/oxidoreductase domain-containing protein
MVTYVFPGQGSQAKGMGEVLFAAFPSQVEQADQILGYSIEALCRDNLDDQLSQTEYTQPALFVVNALSFLKKRADGAPLPDYVAGHSLGEYNALFAAQVIDFETGLKLVQKRGSLMSRAAGGGMAAVIGLTADQVQQILEQEKLTTIAIANYNSNMQIVLSGPKEAISQAEQPFKQGGAKLFIPLKVSGAFHSPLMSQPQQEFEAFIQNFHFAEPKIPVIANISARPYPADEIKSTLAKQITSPVQWTQTIDYLLAQGETVFEEVGPGKVLAGLISRIQKGQ